MKSLEGAGRKCSPFPQAVAKSFALSRVSEDVWMAGMSSTSFYVYNINVSKFVVVAALEKFPYHYWHRIEKMKA